jgi:hypothetical protein
MGQDQIALKDRRIFGLDLDRRQLPETCVHAVNSIRACNGFCDTRMGQLNC